MVLDRILSVVTRVRPGEGKSALLMALNVFLLLTAYYVIKPVREALILATGGAEVKSYAAVGQVALLSVLVPAYGVLVSRMRRQALVPLVTLGFAACLVAFYVAAQVGVPFLGVGFYLFVGIFNLMVVAQFWSLANDVYTKDQGERLFPVVGFGASIGAVAGSFVTSLLVEILGVEALLLVSALVLGLSVLVTRAIEHEAAHGALAPSGEAQAESSPRSASESGTAAPSPRAPSGAFRLVLRSPYLLMIACLMFFANWVNTNGEYILGSVVTQNADAAVAAGKAETAKAFIGKFYADFFLVVNLVGVFLQLFVVSRIIRYWGVRGAIVVLPAIAAVSYLTLALFPVLAVVRAAKTAENATDYSLNNTVRNALFLPLSAEEKFKAKQATDTFFVRGGDVASAALVAVGSAMSWSPEGFAWANLVGVAACLVLALAIGRRYDAVGQS